MRNGPAERAERQEGAVQKCGVHDEPGRLGRLRLGESGLGEHLVAQAPHGCHDPPGLVRRDFEGVVQLVRVDGRRAGRGPDPGNLVRVRSGGLDGALGQSAVSVPGPGPGIVGGVGVRGVGACVQGEGPASVAVRRFGDGLHLGLTGRGEPQRLVDVQPR